MYYSQSGFKNDLHIDATKNQTVQSFQKTIKRPKSSLGLTKQKNNNGLKSSKIEREINTSRLISEKGQEPEKTIILPKNIGKKKPLKENEIEIHVFDQANKCSKNFVCDRYILVNEMQYFKAYLSNKNFSFDDVEISVHCDVNIFEWIMVYIKKKDNPPELDIFWSISILISSDFLKINSLVEKTLQFVHDNLQEIIRQPIELDCITPKLLKMLAKKFTMKELDSIRDKNDKIINKLYIIKIKKLINGNEENNIVKCVNCRKLYNERYSDLLVCRYSNKLILQNGKIRSGHVKKKDFDIVEYLIKASKKMSWKKVYWTTWGIINHFYCERCNSYFPAIEVDFCSYHPKDPLFKPFSNAGIYPCCNRKTFRFDSSRINCSGCRPRTHLISTNELTCEKSNVSLLVENKSLIVLPFSKRNVSGKVKNALEENKKITSKKRTRYLRYKIYKSFGSGDVSTSYEILRVKRKKNDKRFGMGFKINDEKRRYLKMDLQRYCDEDFQQSLEKKLRIKRSRSEPQTISNSKNKKKKKKKGKGKYWF